MSGHQEWLEAPYTNAARREADFEAWCEANSIDPGTDVAWEQFDLLLSDQEPEDDDL